MFVKQLVGVGQYKSFTNESFDRPTQASLKLQTSFEYKLALGLNFFGMLTFHIQFQLYADF